MVEAVYPPNVGNFIHIYKASEQGEAESENYIDLWTAV
jgi:hypothetical protein